MKMTAQEIERLIRVANCSRRDMETILEMAKKFDGFPLSDQDNDTLVDAVNALRGFRKDLQLMQMKMGGTPGR
ncbi:MAG TPA: hypothetical protein VLY20_12065 [Nitrospiria bacterium]|nr:hypothetical protein [Nitrospiria bacterium]